MRHGRKADLTFAEKDCVEFVGGGVGDSFPEVDARIAEQHVDAALLREGTAWINDVACDSSVASAIRCRYLGCVIFSAAGRRSHAYTAAPSARNS